MILIKNGLVIDPANNLEAEKDVLVENGLIRELGQPGSLNSVKIERSIDAKGKWVVPGLIDLHVHLREPGFEWKETIESGSRAAALGGFTSICCMPNTSPTNDRAEITRFILERATQAKLSRVLPIGSVSLALKGQDLAPLSELAQAGCVAFSDDGEPVWNSGLMRRALEWCLMLGLPISCHEEDKCLSSGGCMNESALSFKMGLIGMPKVAEEVMIARDIELARSTGGKVHICHVSSARSVELIRRAKNDHIKISAEVTPHHLLLNEDSVSNYDTNFKMSPPLREQEDVEGLLQGVKDGTLDAIASDHAPHELDSKRVEFSKASFGVIGLQTNLPLTLELIRTEKISRLRAIEAWTSAPAKAFGLPYGTLRKGAAADVCVIDPNPEWKFDGSQVESKSKNSSFLGRDLKGMADTVIRNGEVLVSAGKIEGDNVRK